MSATLSRSLLLSLAIAVAGPALAQSSDKDTQATPKRAAAVKAPTAKREATTKRLDFVPSTNVKPTATATTPAAPTPAQPPAKHDWHCDGEASEA